MFRNYLITALRNLRKHRLYSFITIGGLAVGLAACLLILLFVRDELSYDEWLPKAERIAKLEITFIVPDRDPMEMGQTPGPARAALEKDFSSDIEAVTRIWENGAPIRSADRQFNERIGYVDLNFFEVFDLPLALGVREQALANNTSMVISERIAEKYFGQTPALGQVLTIDNTTDYTVVGVFEDLPRSSHLEFDFIALFDEARYVDYPWISQHWTSANIHTYALFRSEEAISQVESELVGFSDRNVVIDIPGFKGMAMSDLVQFNFVPVLDIHLYARKGGYFKEGGDITTVITFSAIAMLILLIACVNFVNLATARSMSRAREVAMRKVVGANRGQLVVQFLGEAVLVALVALLLAVAMAELALGPYNSFLDKELGLDILGDPSLALTMLALVVVVGLAGGLYPAVYLSRFRPARVLKANQSSASGGTLVRNCLVVFQFAVSIGLIISTGIVYGQMRYARTIDVGFESSNKVAVGGLGDMQTEGVDPDDKDAVGKARGIAKATLKRELLALPHVTAASLSSDGPPLSNNNNTVLYPTATPTDEQFVVETLQIDHDFLSLYAVKPIAGRLFSPDLTSDQRNVPDDPNEEATQSIVVNRTFVDTLGIDSPEAAIGKTFWTVVDQDSDRKIRTTVVGVVEDLHLRSISVRITPLLYLLQPEESGNFNQLSLDVKPGEMAATVAAIQPIWERMAPGVPMRTAYIDEEVAAQYDAIEKRGHMFGVFALFAVLIACLGLFGLASFSAERRKKEIGVRKAHGASVIDIVRLLMWQFSQPVIIANLIAWPTAFFLMNRWLATFKYRIELTDPVLLLSVFGGAGLIAMTIAWATVAGQAARVARANPIHALRCE